MSRWRPKQAASSKIITRQGFEMLKAEVNELWHERRPQVVKALAAAAAEGDRSENAEYTYRKKQLAGIDRRVRYLSKRIPSLQVVDKSPSQNDKVFFAAFIELETLENGALHTYRIVGPDETNAKKGFISVDSPMAKALLGKQLSEEVSVPLPAGTERYTIIDIHYL